MSDEKFKLVLVAPVDKRGMVIKLTISAEDSQTLRIHHYPEFMWYTLGTIGLLGVAIVSLFLNPSILIYCAIILAGVVYKVFNERAFTCTINKKTGVISYHRSGVLMTTLNEQKKEYPISHIQRLEMHRHVRGGEWNLSWSLTGMDTFQVSLLLKNAQRVSLSPSNLNFSECQNVAEQVRDFLGNDISVKAID